MPISTQLSELEDELVINVAGRFDFSAHLDFRNAYEDLERRPQSYAVDLADATYLDSSALGMLLLLRDHAGEVSKQNERRHPAPVARVL